MYRSFHKPKDALQLCTVRNKEISKLEMLLIVSLIRTDQNSHEYTEVKNSTELEQLKLPQVNFSLNQVPCAGKNTTDKDNESYI